MQLGKPDPVEAPSFWDHVTDWFTSLAPWLQAFIMFSTALGFLAAFLKWVKPITRAKAVSSDLRAIRDTLVGRPAMRDSITGAIIPGTARPSIGQRMDDMAESVKKLADASTRLDAHDARFKDHDKRLSRIEDALSIDRRLDKIESVQLLRTIETAVQADPGDDEPTFPRPE